MPEPTPLKPPHACVAIDDWDTLLRAVLEASALDARDRPPAPPPPCDASGVGALAWVQVRGQDSPGVQGTSHE